MTNPLSEVNVAVNRLINGVISESNPPIFPWGGTFLTSGVQTTPGLSRGAMANTGVYITNGDLSHVCDFKFVLSSDFSLTGLIPNLGVLAGAIKNGKNAAANAIRAALTSLIGEFRIAIKAITFALNLDPSGEFSKQYSIAKGVIRDINEKLSQIAQVIADVAMVYYLIQDIQMIITWIESLPDKLKAMIKGCLAQFTQSLASVQNQVKGTLNQIQSQMTTGLVAQLTTAQTASTTANNGVSQAFMATITDPLNSNAAAINGFFTSSSDSANVLLSTTITNKKSAASKP